MATLRADLLQREQTPISYNQIKRVTNKHVSTHFALHDGLPEVPEDKHLFGKTNCCCLMVTKHIVSKHLSLNHWVAIIKRPKGNYEFFDPLGNSIKRLTMMLHSGKKSLANWASSRRVSENTIKHQKHDSDVNTCGCHVAVRLVHHHMINAKYSRWLSHGFLPADLSVSAMCYIDLIKKIPLEKKSAARRFIR